MAQKDAKLPSEQLKMGERGYAFRREERAGDSCQWETRDWEME